MMLEYHVTVFLRLHLLLGFNILIQRILNAFNSNIVRSCNNDKILICIAVITLNNCLLLIKVQRLLTSMGIFLQLQRLGPCPMRILRYILNAIGYATVHSDNHHNL